MSTTASPLFTILLNLSLSSLFPFDHITSETSRRKLQPCSLCRVCVRGPECLFPPASSSILGFLATPSMDFSRKTASICGNSLLISFPMSFLCSRSLGFQGKKNKIFPHQKKHRERAQQFFFI